MHRLLLEEWHTYTGLIATQHTASKYKNVYTVHAHRFDCRSALQHLSTKIVHSACTQV